MLKRKDWAALFYCGTPWAFHIIILLWFWWDIVARDTSARLKKNTYFIKRWVLRDSRLHGRVTMMENDFKIKETDAIHQSYLNRTFCATSGSKDYIV